MLPTWHTSEPWPGWQVIRIESAWEGKELPELCAEESDYAADLFKGTYRTDIKPLNIEQPEGPSFTVLPPSNLLVPVVHHTLLISIPEAALHAATMSMGAISAWRPVTSARLHHMAAALSARGQA